MTAEREFLDAPPRVRKRVPIPLTLPGGGGDGRLAPEFVTFHGLSDKKEHIAIVFGEPSNASPPLVRIHSECLTGDVFGSQRCDCGPQLMEAMQKMSQHGGIILYLRQEGRGIGLYNKMDAYSLQQKGVDTFTANHQLGFPGDMRDYSVAAEMLSALDINRLQLLSNNPEKCAQLKAAGLEVIEQVRTAVHETPHNSKYLAAKQRHGHKLSVLGAKDSPKF